MGPASPGDRELAADVVHLVGELDGFEGFFILRNQSEYRGAVVIDDDLARVRASARLTALGGAPVLIVSSMSAMGHGGRVVLSGEEMAAAAKRAEARRAAWDRYCLDVDVHVSEWTRRVRSLFIVSEHAGRVADVLRTNAGTPLTTYGTADVDRVLDVLAIYAMPRVIVLDSAMAGTLELEKRIRATYPARFGVFGRVQWISTAPELRAVDIERVLQAVGTTFRPSLMADGAFSRLRILVVEDEDGTLADEVARAAPGAEVERSTGWEALDRIEAAELDVIVAGDPGDVSLPSLVRFVHRSKSTPLLMLAMDAPKSERMGSAYPKLADYFVARPISTDDMRRALPR